MSLECAECERDMRGPHDGTCSWYTWVPSTGEIVIHPDHGEGVVDWVDDEDGEARVKYDGVTAWTSFDGLKPQVVGIEDANT